MDVKEKYYMVSCNSIKTDFEVEELEEKFKERSSLYMDGKKVFFIETEEGSLKEWFTEYIFKDYGDVYYCEQLGLYINKESLKVLSLNEFVKEINKIDIINTELDYYTKRYFEIAKELYDKDENIRDQIHLNLVLNSEVYTK